jgi:hypothetical protein
VGVSPSLSRNSAGKAAKKQKKKEKKAKQATDSLIYNSGVLALTANYSQASVLLNIEAVTCNSPVAPAPKEVVHAATQKVQRNGKQHHACVYCDGNSNSCIREKSLEGIHPFLIGKQLV